jgi:hypothetical protein
MASLRRAAHQSGASGVEHYALRVVVVATYDRRAFRHIAVQHPLGQFVFDQLTNLLQHFARAER